MGRAEPVLDRVGEAVAVGVEGRGARRTVGQLRPGEVAVDAGSLGVVQHELVVVGGPVEVGVGVLGAEPEPGLGHVRQPVAVAVGADAEALARLRAGDVPTTDPGVGTDLDLVPVESAVAVGVAL